MKILIANETSVNPLKAGAPNNQSARKTTRKTNSRENERPLARGNPPSEVRDAR